MPTKRFKPVFERTLEEQLELIKPEVERIQLENLASGLYNSYRDDRSKSNNVFIRQYKDRREVIRIDAATGITQTLETLR